MTVLPTFEKSAIPNDGRLPMLLGFQAVGENQRANTTLIERGKGIFVYDSEGREYIEASSSFYVAALGYMHEELIEAIKEQYSTLPFYTSAIQRTSQVALDLAERLTELIPVDDSHILFATTGSEANDFLIKLFWFRAVARGLPQKRKIIGRHGSYAGGTLGTASLTGAHHGEFGLPLPDFLHVSQPDFHGCRFAGETKSEYSDRLSDELRTLLEAQPEQSIAAMVAEPVSFSGGISIPPADYFRKITKILRTFEVDLVVDEVITGFGRTGAWFGAQTLGIEPDHLVSAKGITAGYFPLSVAAIGSDMYADLESGSAKMGTLAHAATYAAHPVGAATALKTIEIMQRDGVIASAKSKGEYFAQQLAHLGEHPLVGDIRTIGLSAAIDFFRRDIHDDAINDDAGTVAAAVSACLLKEGIVARQTERCVQFAPPLIIKHAEIDLLVERTSKALDMALDQIQKYSN